jgi:hypothetical protein
MLCRRDELGGRWIRLVSLTGLLYRVKTRTRGRSLTPDLPFLKAIDDTLPLNLSYPQVPLAGSYVYTLRPSMSTK